MKFSKISVKGCCGKSANSLKLEGSISKDFISLLVSNGFTELKQYTKAGMLYVENNNLIITGLIGSDKLQLNCKNKFCNENIDLVESLLSNLEINNDQL